MNKSKRQFRALAAVHLDLFQAEDLGSPAPATLYSKIAQEAKRLPDPDAISMTVQGQTPNCSLPSVAGLYHLFERFNWLYFDGKLPNVRIEYSKRMTSAGSYTPSLKLIKISWKYHEIFPQDLEDTLKHEMLHILYPYHDADFKREARRIGATLKAQSHPKLQRQPKYVYVCEGCQGEYPRQKRLILASCGKCSRGGRYDERFKLKLKWSAKQSRRQTQTRG